MSLGDSSCYPYIQKNHKVFGSKFATHIAFPCFSCTVDLEAFGMCETLPALRSVPKEPKEAPKAKAPAPAAVPSAATAPAAAPEKMKEDEAPAAVRDVS